MKRLSCALVLGVFGSSCLLAWAMLTLMSDVKSAGRALPYFTNLCITLRPGLIALPIVAAAYYLWLWFRKEESLSRRIVYSADYLVAHSPITRQYTGHGGLTVGEICEAAMTLSDNTAGNLLLDSFGGPAQLTAYLRSLGDRVTRLDRRETALNEAMPGDPRDTTTPAAMLEILRQTVLGSALSASSRDQLVAWLVANKTGDQRLRAGVPQGWRVGDKTGSGAHNTTNDIAVVWPPRRAPIIVTTYYTEARASDDERNAVLSEVARLAIAV